MLFLAGSSAFQAELWDSLACIWVKVTQPTLTQGYLVKGLRLVSGPRVGRSSKLTAGTLGILSFCYMFAS